jgi:UDP-N-acetylmuramyl pentapeptide phosphotransferase/UDP-N-acetylglucosamine-1-phosphate transferase
LIIPVFDTARVFAKRILNGKSPFMPDKNHVHHILIRMGFSQVQTVLFLAFLNLATILAAFLLSEKGDNFLLVFFLIYFAIFFVTLEIFGSAKSKR